MLRILFLSLIAFFTLYGIISFILHRIMSPFQAENCTIHPPYTVLSVKNQADSIEATIRSTVWHMLSQSHNRYINDIVVIDMGSTDETMSILNSLSREYEFIHPMTKERYISLLDSLCE